MGRRNERCTGLASVRAEDEGRAGTSKPQGHKMAAGAASAVIENCCRQLHLIGDAKRMLAIAWYEHVRACTFERLAKIVLGIRFALDHKDREAGKRRMFQEESLARGNADERRHLHQRRLLAEIGSSISQAPLTPD